MDWTSKSENGAEGNIDDGAVTANVRALSSTAESMELSVVDDSWNWSGQAYEPNVQSTDALWISNAEAGSVDRWEIEFSEPVTDPIIHFFGLERTYTFNSDIELLSSSNPAAFALSGSRIDGITCGSDGDKSGSLLMRGTFQTISIRGSGLSGCGNQRDAIRLQVGVGITKTNEEPPIRITAYDPVPNLLEASGFGHVTDDFDRIVSDGREVDTVVADGVARIVLAVSSEADIETYRLTVLNESGDPTSDSSHFGSLSETFGNATPNFSEQVRISEQNSNEWPAFAIYRAPANFVASEADTSSFSREVKIRIELCSGGVCQPGTVESVRIIRPPLALLHGLWSNRAAWNTFAPLYSSEKRGDERFSIARLDYEPTNWDSLRRNALRIRENLETRLRLFKAEQRTAAVQWDIVAHSMGGLIVRRIIRHPDFQRRGNYGQGLFNRLISVDTPHRGSEFADRLLRDVGGICRSTFDLIGNRIAGAVRDLSPTSFEITNNLRLQSFGLPTHTISGIAGRTQHIRVLFLIVNFFDDFGCAGILPARGFREVFGGNSDLIVSETSQRASALNFTPGPTNERSVSVFQPAPDEQIAPAIFGTAFERGRGYIHAQNLIFNAPPDVLGRGTDDSALQERVIEILNSDVEETEFRRIVP